MNFQNKLKPLNPPVIVRTHSFLQNLHIYFNIMWKHSHIRQDDDNNNNKSNNTHAL